MNATADSNPAQVDTVARIVEYLSALGLVEVTEEDAAGEEDPLT